MIKGNSLNRKETIKEETWNIKKEKNIGVENRSKYNRLSRLKFSKLHLMIEAKIISLSSMVINAYRGNI